MGERESLGQCAGVNYRMRKKIYPETNVRGTEYNRISMLTAHILQQVLIGQFTDCLLELVLLHETERITKGEFEKEMDGLIGKYSEFLFIYHFDYLTKNKLIV